MVEDCKLGCVRPMSLFYSDASADALEERSLVPRSRSHARLKRNATMSHALSCVQPAFIVYKTLSHQKIRTHEAAAVKFVTRASQWREIGMRGRRGYPVYQLLVDGRFRREAGDVTARQTEVVPLALESEGVVLSTYCSTASLYYALVTDKEARTYSRPGWSSAGSSANERRDHNGDHARDRLTERVVQFDLI
ncbi:hypothetical protein EVAR_84706_1 [Eumeta japonica]|uniref:Uncharacterized protein n=1 Tax=Eumeta variegata TaxID=151549 RepID=A0A4C1VRQ2_EUMVA|nr:hypothetical protein EVAR_84706_1 [Eumeta japonica]